MTAPGPPGGARRWTEGSAPRSGLGTTSRKHFPPTAESPAVARPALPPLATGVALLVLVTAGCAGPLSDRPGGPSPASSAGPTTSGTAITPYPDEVVPFPDGPKSRPSLPDDLTAETAADYARLHEFRYSYNELWRGPGTEVGMSAEGSCDVESVQQRGDGFLVVVRCVGYVNRPSGDPNSTATIHADLPPWTVRYYVDADSIRRREVP